MDLPFRWLTSTGTISVLNILFFIADIDLLYEISNGESNSSSFSITNIGELESLLTYSINVNQFQNPLGGPDFSENYWTDSNSEFSENYDWIDISNIGTLYNFPTNDDSGDRNHH